MEPGDAVELAKTGCNGAAGFAVGHFTGNDLIVYLTVVYLTGQCIVLAPKVWATVRRWLHQGVSDG